MHSLLSWSVSNYTDILDREKAPLLTYKTEKKYKTSSYTRNNYCQKHCRNGQTNNCSLTSERKHRPKVSTLLLLATTYVKKAPLRVKDNKTDLLPLQKIGRRSELLYTNYSFEGNLYSSYPRTFSIV